MSDKEKAEAEKTLGNDYFNKQEYFKAAAHYTKAIKLDPTNHVLYSNRSASYMKMDPPKDVKALADADKAIELNPTWPKGYNRRAQALASLNRWDEAEEAMQKCVKLEPSMKKEATTFTKQLNVKRSTRAKETVEQLLTREAYKQAKIEKDLALAYSEERNQSFLDQVLNAVRHAVTAGSSALAALDGLVVVLPSSLSTRGTPELFPNIRMDRALLSEDKQRQTAAELKARNSSAHSLVFITQRSALLAPRRWETHKDSLPAKSEGVFVQFQSRTNRSMLYLPLTSSSQSQDPASLTFETIPYADFAILPPVF